jgi:hypothetical protein
MRWSDQKEAARMVKKKITRCGLCALAASVKAGTVYKKLVKGEVVKLSKKAALAELKAKCRCDLFGAAAKAHRAKESKANREAL